MKVGVLLKIIETVYTKNPGMQKLIDEWMMDICKEEGVSPEQVFFAGLCCWFYRYELNINFLCAKDSLWKYKGLFLVLIKKQKQKETKFFDAEILSA